MKKILLFLSFLLMSIGVFGEELYRNEGATGTSSGITASGNVNTNSTNGNPGNSFANTSSSNTTFTFTGFNLSGYTNLEMSIDAKFYSFPVTTEVWPYTTITFSKNNIVVKTDNTTLKWATKNNTYNTYTISNIPDFDKITIVCSPASGLSGKGNPTTNYATYMDNIVITGDIEGPITYTVTYDVNGGTGTMTDTNSPYNSGATVTVLTNTFTRDNYTFDRWNTAANGSGVDYDADDTFTITANTTLYAQCIENETPSSDPTVGRLVFELLTDINDLQDGDSIIILDKDNTYAMSVQKTNNRAGSNTFDIIDNIVEVTDNSVQIIRADTVGGSNNWKLVVNDGFLYAASSNKNYLKTQTKNDANGQWSITLNNNVASIIAQGSNTRNRMEYNVSAELFACYSKSEQTQPKIYKKIPCDEIYSVLFMNNYSNYDTIDIPSCVRRLHELPTNPSNGVSACNSSGEFAGWSKHEITGDNEKPSDLFKTLQNSPYINSNDTFHAVFAIKNNSVESPASTISVFKTKGWVDSDNLWSGDVDGYAKNSQGVQVTSKSEYQNAGATTRNSYYKITSIIVTYSTNPTKGTGAINVKINGTSLGNTPVTKDGGSTDRTITYTPVNATTGTVSFSVTCGDNSIYIKSIQINYTDYEYDFYQTYCTDTLKSGSSWNSGTWSLGRSPQSNERAVVLVPVNVDIEHAKAKEVVITQNGKLTIGANKGLEVHDTISVHNGTYRATTPTDLVLESSSAGNASLIFNNNNETQATVCLYSKANIDRTVTPNQWNWQYMGTAMTSLNALYNYYGSWVYRWDGEQQKWVGVPNGGTMTAWTGYCITQETPEWYATTGTLVETDTRDVTLSVPANSNMVFANSWTAPIHVYKFTPETFTLDTMNVYLFNTGSDSTGTGAIGKTLTAPGTYVVMPIYSSKFTGDSLIAPQQGFYITTGDNAGTITLKYKDLVRTDGSDDIVAGAMRSPKRNVANHNPVVMKIYVNGSKYGDKVVILEKEDFSTGFDNGWDGKKMSFDDESPSIYVVNESGTYDAVSAIPDYEGTVLGFKSGSDSICKIKFEYSGDNEWYLNDLVTLTSTLISSDNEYVFATDSTNHVRFIISATPYANVATDINNTSDVSNKIQKYLYHGNLYIIKNNRIFNTIGSLIK